MKDCKILCGYGLMKIASYEVSRRSTSFLWSNPNHRWDGNATRDCPWLRSNASFPTNARRISPLIKPTALRDRWFHWPLNEIESSLHSRNISPTLYPYLLSMIYFVQQDPEGNSPRLSPSPRDYNISYPNFKYNLHIFHVLIGIVQRESQGVHGWPLSP